MADWITEDEQRRLAAINMFSKAGMGGESSDSVEFLLKLVDKADREIRSLRAILPADFALRTKQFEARVIDAFEWGWKDGFLQKEYNPQQIDSSYINYENWSAVELELLRTKYMEGYIERGHLPTSTEDKK